MSALGRAKRRRARHTRERSIQMLFGRIDPSRRTVLRIDTARARDERGRRFLNPTRDRSQGGSASETPGAEVFAIPGAEQTPEARRALSLSARRRGLRWCFFFLSSIQQRSDLGVGSVLDSVDQSWPKAGPRAQIASGARQPRFQS
jgi:hypothetical protein